MPNGSTPKRRSHKTHKPHQGTLTRDLLPHEIDPVTYQYTLTPMPSKYWHARTPEPNPGELFSDVRVFDGAGRLVRIIRKETLQARGGFVVKGSTWMGVAGWVQRGAQKPQKHLGDAIDE